MTTSSTSNCAANNCGGDDTTKRPHMSRPRLPATLAAHGRAVGETTHEAQPRPGVVDRADLVVDESRGEADPLHRVEVQISDHARRALRPRDPQTAIALQRV